MSVKTAKKGEAAAAPPNFLTTREQEICKLLLEGIAPKEIAYKLNISYGTILTHQRNLYRKLGVKSIQELFAKYHTGDTTVPLAEEDEAELLLMQKKLSKKTLLKIFIPSAATLSAPVCVRVLLPSKTQDDGYPVVFDKWHAIHDKKSTVLVQRKNEEINGKMEATVILSGMRYDFIKSFSGAYGIPVAEDLNALRKFKSFSLQFIGDGNRYYIRFPTFETVEGDHWLFIFQTVKDEISSILVDVPDDLIRFGWSGNDAEFIIKNIMSVQIQPVDAGDYRLKFWDFRLF